MLIVGQFRSRGVCPLCGVVDGGKWTCTSCTRLVDVHRELIRNLQAWRTLYEACEAPADLVNSLDGETYNLWDLTVFYERRSMLADRQQQAIEMFLYRNMLERDAALEMGIKGTNPIGVYATIGLTQMLANAVSGSLPGYFVALPDLVVEHREPISA